MQLLLWSKVLTTGHAWREPCMSATQPVTVQPTPCNALDAIPDLLSAIAGTIQELDNERMNMTRSGCILEMIS